MEYPLSLEKAFSTNYCWYFGEVRGMGLRYHQAGLAITPLEDHMCDVDQKYKYFSCIRRKGK